MDLEGLVSAFQNDSLGVEDGVAIAEKIKNGALDRRTVTQDAIKRAQMVNSKLNAVAVENFDSALKASEDSFLLNKSTD